MNRRTMFNTSPDADHFVGLLRIWDIVKSYNSVIKYADSLGFNENDIFEGYRYFIETWLRSFLEEITKSKHVPLEGNYEFYRADHQGVNISKMSNSCEKIIFIRNYHSLLRKLKKSKKTDCYTVLAEFDKFISKFESKFNQIIQENDDFHLKKKARIKFATISRGLFLFNQIKEIPEGRFFNLFKDSITKQEMKNNFLGYKITLLHMWKQVFSKKQFELVKGIKKTIYWDRQTVTKKYISGMTINCFFRKINEGIVEPLRKEKNTDLIYDIYFLFKKSMVKHVFNLFLENIPAQLNEQEKIDELFLWYKAEVIDSSKRNIFNGATYLIILLEGAVSWAKISGNKNPIQLLKIQHKNENRHDYSYGILIESRGSFGSDYSGWVIFYDVCGDYSGFSGMEHAYIEGTIKSHLKNKSVTIREKEMPREDLEKYLLKKSTYRSITQNEKKHKEATEMLNKARGILFEFLVYYLQNQKEDKVKWSFEFENEETDILIETNDSIKIIECKLDPKNLDIDRQIKKLKDKIELYKSGKQKSGEFWFWYKIYDKKIEEKLESEKIAYLVVPEILKNLPDVQKINKRISPILNYKNQAGEFL